MQKVRDAIRSGSLDWLPYGSKRTPAGLLLSSLLLICCINMQARISHTFGTDVRQQILDLCGISQNFVLYYAVDKMQPLVSVVTLVLLAKGSKGGFHTVDTDTFIRSGSPDPNELRSPDYFRRWINDQFNPVASQLATSDSLSDWEFETNITNQTEADTVTSAQQVAKFYKAVSDMVKRFDVDAMKPDVTLQRLHKLLREIGDQALSTEDLAELKSTVNYMSSVYSTAKICFSSNSTTAELDHLSQAGCPPEMQTAFDPVLQNYLRDVWNDTQKRKYVWEGWRNVSGGPIRSNFTRYVELKNKAARLTGYPDAGALWRSEYTVESENYTDAHVLRDLDNLWLQIKPLYQELHAYVRRKLIEKYPNDGISATGPIPAHLVGDMWSQTWDGMLNLTQLFPEKPLLDVTEEMKAQNYTIDRMFHLSEQFQKDLGLIPMPASFWNLTMFSKPTDRDVVCHPSAWDFQHDLDVRIKMCTVVQMEDLITIHHEMGHIQYFLQYSNQSLEPFRSGANAGFHEAVGDTLALSVKTPRHLAWLGLLRNNTDDNESDLNYMFAMAMDKIAFLPFAYITDRYRYDVFSGKIPTEELSAGWWKYVTEYQGLSSPVTRTENDFDPGSKFHVAADVEYMRYFISFVIQFQFHKALCDASGHTGPFYQCDINRSKAAGKLLSDMLSLGASQPWPDAMEKITGKRRMDASPLLEFFEPVVRYLRELNRKNNETVGWSTRSKSSPEVSLNQPGYA